MRKIACNILAVYCRQFSSPAQLSPLVARPGPARSLTPNARTVAVL